MRILSQGKLSTPGKQCRLSRFQHSRLTVLTRAGDNNNSDNGNSEVDWDSAWASFQRQMRSQVDVRVGTRAPPPPSAPAGTSPVEQRIRREEIAFAGAVSSEAFYAAAALSTFVILLLVIVNAPTA